jgi:hypothetical protein
VCVCVCVYELHVEACCGGSLGTSLRFLPVCMHVSVCVYIYIYIYTHTHTNSVGAFRAFVEAFLAPWELFEHLWEHF